MKIGEYIHYQYVNYKKHGLTYQGNSAPPSVNSIYNNQKNHVLKYVKARIKTDNSKAIQLQNMLNYFFRGGKKINLGFTDTEIAQMEKAISGVLQDKIDDVYQNIDINTLGLKSGVSSYKNLAGGVLTSDVPDQLRKRIVSFGALKPTVEHVNYASIENRLRTLQELFKSLASVGVNHPDLENRLTVMQKQWDSISMNKNFGSFQKQYNFISSLNDFIKEVKGSAISKELGQVVEDAVGLLGGAMTSVMNKSVNETYDYTYKILTEHKGSQQQNAFINSYITGDSRSAAALKSSNFVTNTHTSQQGFTFNANSRYYNVQEKVDVSINFKDFQFDASVKNTNLQNKMGSISLQSGAGILNLIQDFPVFVNHYLNIVPDRPDSWFLGNPPMTEIKIMNNAMKFTVGAMSLVGGTYRNYGKSFGYSPMANYLIINDSSKQGQFKVINMHTLLTKMVNNIDLIDAPSIDGINLIMRWRGKDRIRSMRSSYSRIANLLLQLHQQKISVSLKNTIF